MSTYVWEIVEVGSIDYGVESIPRTLYASLASAERRVKESVDDKEYTVEFTKELNGWSCAFRRRRKRKRYASRGFLIVQQQVLP